MARQHLTWHICTPNLTLAHAMVTLLAGKCHTKEEFDTGQVLLEGKAKTEGSYIIWHTF